jgi:PEP-CTERM putative exosortase interaction domain
MRKLLFATAAMIAVSAAEAAPVVIEDGFVKAGVNDLGTLGSGGNNPPGILYDKTGAGSYGINDFLTPGTPFEGFYIKSSTGFWGANNTGDTAFSTGAPHSLSGNTASWTGTSTDGALIVSNTYGLTTLSGRSVIAVTTTITNIGTVNMTGLEFLRTLDPDPDVNAYGVYDTANAILSGDACGTGQHSGQTICIGTETGITHKVGISALWSTDPDVYLAGVNDGAFGDYAIGIAFALGDLAAKGVTTFNYYYALGADSGTASGGGGNTGVPEPLTLGLFGAGLFGLWRSRRSKNA